MSNLYMMCVGEDINRGSDQWLNIATRPLRVNYTPSGVSPQNFFYCVTTQVISSVRYSVLQNKCWKICELLNAKKPTAFTLDDELLTTILHAYEYANMEDNRPLKGTVVLQAINNFKWWALYTYAKFQHPPICIIDIEDKLMEMLNV